MDKIFNNLLSDLCELEERGISFNGKIYKGTVACIMGDNLGSHMIGGFKAFQLSSIFLQILFGNKK